MYFKAKIKIYSMIWNITKKFIFPDIRTKKCVGARKFQYKIVISLCYYKESKNVLILNSFIPQPNFTMHI